MSLNSVIATMQTILDRSDCTPAQAQTFVVQSINDIQRELRIPCMERLQVITATGPLTWFPVPTDLIELIDILVPDPCGNGQWMPLRKKPYRDLVQMNPLDTPRAYARFQSQYFIAGTVPAGTQVQCLYYGEFTPIDDPNTDNEITSTQPDMIVYGALSYAGDTFVHPSTDRWTARYQALKAEVQDMADELEVNGGPAEIRPMYYDSFDPLGEYH